MGFSLGYAVSVLPVLLFYKYLESPDNFLKPCKKIKQGMIFAANGGGGRRQPEHAALRGPGEAGRADQSARGSAIGS